MPSPLYFTWKQTGDYTIAPNIPKVTTAPNNATLSAGVGSLRVYSNNAADCAGNASVTLVDLTLLYGTEIGGLTDTEILAKYGADFGTGYHEYNEGTLISNDASGLETVGFNQWDEEWEEGVFSNFGEKTSYSGYFRSKNKVPVSPTTVYGITKPSGECRGYFYDADEKFISYVVLTNSTTFTTPSNARYFAFYIVGTTYNNDICINLSDASKNGTYEPYWKRTLNLGLNAIRVKSHNIWDEEWEVGTISQSTGVNQADSTRLRSKNYISVNPGDKLYFHGASRYAYFWILYYDSNMQFIVGSTDGSTGYKNNVDINNIGTVPANARYLRFYCATQVNTYQDDICINVSSSFNEQYEPHGILTFNGVKSAGSVYDEIVGNKYVKRVGRVDLGSLTYTYNSNVPVFYTDANYKVRAQCICSTYPISKEQSAAANQEDKSVSIYDSGRLYIKDSAYTNATSLKAAMSGVMLYYELATPIEYELADAIPCITQYSEYGTQRIISPQSSTPSAPFYGEWQYGIQQGDFISGLENSEFMIGSSTYIISEEEFNEIFGDL